MKTTNNLKEIRKAKGLTLEQVGDMIGSRKSQIYSLERGQEPMISTAYAVSKALGVDIYKIWPDKTEIVEETIIVRRIVKRN